MSRHCTCRATRDHFKSESKETLVILTDRESSPQVKGVVAISFSQSHDLKGEVWEHESFASVTTLRFEDPIPEDLGDFTLQVCTAGKALTKAEIEGYSRWKKAAKSLRSSGR